MSRASAETSVPSVFDEQQPSAVAQQLGKMAERVRSRMAGVRHTLAVMSGKGGVGKSLVTAGLAQAFTERGLRVGVVDADVNGPCAPRMLGVTGSFGVASPEGVQPAVGHGGVKVASMGLLLDTAGKPVDWKTPASRTLRSAWRGAMEMTALRELVSDVAWGDLDVLLFDLPPGTGDKEEVLLRWLPALGGAVFVTTSSPLVLEVVERSIRFATQIGVRVIGVISNLDGATCPHCGAAITQRRDEAAPAQLSRLGVPLLGRLPRDPELGRLGDEGLPLFRSGPGASSAEVFRVLAQRVWDCLECRPADYL